MSLVTLAQAKAQLNYDPLDVSQDTKIQGYIDAATTVAESIAGNLVQRTIAGEVHSGGNTMVCLRHTPVISITSITEYVGTSAFVLTSQPLGSSVNNYGYDLVDANGGLVLRRGASGDPMAFLGGDHAVSVSYVAGYATIPAAVQQGTLVLIQHWWQNTQQSFGIGGTPANPADGYSVIAGYAVPNFVASMFAALPSSPRRIPGIA